MGLLHKSLLCVEEVQVLIVVFNESSDKKAPRLTEAQEFVQEVNVSLLIFCSTFHFSIRAVWMIIKF